jgi:hypothetical protein
LTGFLAFFHAASESGFDCSALLGRVLPKLGGARFSEIRRIDVHDLADRLCAEGLDASTVRKNVIDALRLMVAPDDDTDVTGSGQPTSSMIRTSSSSR